MSEAAPSATSVPQMEMEIEPELEPVPEPEPELPEGDDTLFDFQPSSSSDGADDDDSLLNDDSTLPGASTSTSGEEASELTLETREERAYAESIARAQRKMRQDDYGTIHPGMGAGWPKKSLLEASTASSSGSGGGNGKQMQRPALGSAAATAGVPTEQSAAALKAARANAVSRRDLTVRKLHQARRSKRMQQQQMQQQPAQQEQAQQNLSTPRTPRKTLKVGMSASSDAPGSPGTPNTPNTLNTTLSSMGSPWSLSAGGAGRMTPTRSWRSGSPSPTPSPSGGFHHRRPVSPPPPSARAYNRFFPPKMVETHDVEGTDSAVCVEPDAVTGEVELHIEEKIFMTDPVAASEAATTSQELFGASKWDQIAEMAKKKLEERGSGGGYADQEEEYFHSHNISSVMSDDRSVFSQKSLPSVLGNESIFHDTAVQAVASLLSLPNYASPRRSSYEAATAAIPEGVSVDADEETSSAISGLSGFSTYSAANNTRGMFEATLQATPEMGEDEMSVQSFITGHLEDFVQSIPDQMITPTSQQLDVIAAIHTNGSEEETPMTTAATRGLMTRRMNACGSLKLLASRSANRTQLAWTGGILAALTSVLADSPFNYVDKATYNAYMVARERSVSALVCLSAEKDNRILLLHSPGLVHSLIKTIDEDDRECRLGCCVVLKNLSLAIENRRLMAQIPGLIDALLEVITGGNKDLITAELYDSSPNENLHAARANAFAVFMNLTKERENAVSPIQCCLETFQIFTLLYLTIIVSFPSYSHSRSTDL